MTRIYKLSKMDGWDWAITIALSGSSIFTIAFAAFTYLRW